MVIGHLNRMGGPSPNAFSGIIANLKIYDTSMPDPNARHADATAIDGKTVATPTPFIEATTESASTPLSELPRLFPRQLAPKVRPCHFTSLRIRFRRHFRPPFLGGRIYIIVTAKRKSPRLASRCSRQLPVMNIPQALLPPQRDATPANPQFRILAPSFMKIKLPTRYQREREWRQYIIQTKQVPSGVPKRFLVPEALSLSVISAEAAQSLPSHSFYSTLVSLP